MTKPESAQYYYQHTYYMLGQYYAKYFSKGIWRESGSVTNLKLMEFGTQL